LRSAHEVYFDEVVQVVMPCAMTRGVLGDATSAVVT
jgi:hypothetical protein